MGVKKKKLRIALLTSCSASRRFMPICCVSDIPQSRMAEACDWWVKHLDVPKSKMHTPGEIYSGPAYTTITELCQYINPADVFIVTGGQGLINLEEKITPYDFTSDKTQLMNIHQRIEGEKFIPHIWWQLINERRGKGSNPIADLIMENKYDIILGALTKGFIRYIVQDLGVASDASNVFIPIPRSILSTFPKALHHVFVPYETEYADNIGAMRSNKSHKVVLKFLRQILDGTDAHTLKLAIQATSITEALNRVSTKTSIDYTKLFEEHKELLDLDTPEQVIQTCKILGIKVGGSRRFIAEWRGAVGTIDLNPVEKNITERARAAMDSIVKSRSEIALSINSDEMILQRLGLFVQTYREMATDGAFTCKDVANWWSTLYDEEMSASKLTRTLSYNAQYLGITQQGRYFTPL